MDNSVSSSFNPNTFQMRSQATDTTSLSSAQASEFEDAESGVFCTFLFPQSVKIPFIFINTLQELSLLIHFPAAHYIYFFLLSIF